MKHVISRGLPLLALGLGALSAQSLPGGSDSRGLHGDTTSIVPSAPRAKPLDPRLAGLQPRKAGVSPAILTLSQNDPRFAAGLAIFNQDFHQADGLGAPGLNADSCRGCHQDPVVGGAGGLELNVTRFGDDGNGTYPFQNLPGGQGLSKLYPPWVAGREEYDPQTATVFEQRQTPSILGAGLLDSIYDSAILANEDPTDRDGDGIFGIARLVSVAGQTEVGRFGWKAQAPRLRDFVMDAMGGELGITTPDDGRGFALLADADPTPDPELAPGEVELLSHFLERLPAPQRRESDRVAEVALGETLFESIGCAVCHIPALDSPHGPVALYSDLLLHDVMPANYRGMAEPGAGMGLFRTPPLWGIRTTPPYMHDGRASSLLTCVLAHESEADGVVASFQSLSQTEQDALILFLEHL
jgi:hypothetical protein